MHMFGPTTRRRLGGLLGGVLLAASLPLSAAADPLPPGVQPGELVTESTAVDPTPASSDVSPGAAPASSVFSSPDQAVATWQAPTTQALQGAIQVDIIAPDSIRVGENVTYTVAYTNTTSSPANFTIQTIWDSFRTTPGTSGQFCLTSGLNNACKPISVSGSVSQKACPDSNSSALSNQATSNCYDVANLAGGGSGKFSVVLGTGTLDFPQTGKGVIRRSASALLYTDVTKDRISEDTASALVKAPVLVPSKTTPDPNKKVYPTLDTSTPNEHVEFTVSVGNATGSGDVSGSLVRPDAIPATNVVLVDNIPQGVELVSAEGGPAINTTNRTITWQIGKLDVSASRSFKIVFRKATGTSGQCDAVNNSTYSATSDEYPLNNGSRVAVRGAGVSVRVVQPVQIVSIDRSPSNIPFGGQGTIAIVVRDYWNRALSGATLRYVVQSNADFVQGSQSAGGSYDSQTRTVSWPLNVAAPTNADPKNNPQEARFTLSVVAKYTKQVDSGTGVATIEVPADVPLSCSPDRTGAIGTYPRLLVTKTTTEQLTVVNGVSYVTKGYEFQYTVTAENRGTARIDGVTLTDNYPISDGAAFAYVENSASLAPEVDSTTLRWSNLSIDAGQKLTITYRMRIDGLDYAVYCNQISAQTADSEAFDYGNRKVCTKINPNIVVTKRINDSTATTIDVSPGQEVKFTLTLKNNEKTAYDAGLYDCLNDFTFSRAESGGTPASLGDTSVGKKCYKWPSTTLQPGQSVTVVFYATVPAVCQTKDYANEGLFYNQQSSIIRMIPSAKVVARVVCGSLRYKLGINPTTASLGDQLVYTLELRNEDANAISGATGLIILPQGFQYIAMDSTSSVATPPQTATQDDGTTTLNWSGLAVPKTTTIKLVLRVRAGEVVGKHKSFGLAGPSGICNDTCDSISRNDGNTYSAKEVTISPLATLEPKIQEAGCAKPGDTRTYQVVIVNSNSHSYNNTKITLTLPFGLQFVQPLGDTPHPAITFTADGSSQVVWSGLTIPARGSAAFAQKTLSVKLRVGQVYGELATAVQASSPDGSLPRKEGVSDPIVSATCTPPSQLGVYKEVGSPLARVGDQVYYQLMMVNTTANDMNVSLADQLPSGMSYVGMVKGTAPTVSGTKLTWNVSVPAAVDGKAGTTAIIFKTRFDSNTSGKNQVTNTVQVLSPATYQKGYENATFTIPLQLFLPIVRR